jgi:hypothetical protein
MYEHRYEPRRPDRRIRLLGLSLLLLAAALLAVGVIVFVRAEQVEKVDRPVYEVGGIKQVSTVEDAHLAVYDGNGFRPQFWSGVNLGATLPGHAPGELAPTKADYLRWFGEMEETNVDVVRVYTILSPAFYEALQEFNSTRENPLWLIQGVWSPEEKLIGDDEEGRDAYTPEITEEFRQEIVDAVRVVHGDANLPERSGHASGRFRADVSQYMLGWIVGTEWYPYAVQETDRANVGTSPFTGEYFRSTEDATPFESWLASMLEALAKEETEYGWQHPVALTNWLTTDPLSHPDEASEHEDLVSVDPMHLEPTAVWKAGYFASYHVYPYYPDFMRYETKYQDYTAADGEKDPYAGYLNELRTHDEGIPLIVAEYGVPTSRGMAHEGPLGRDQGHHTETAQGNMEAKMLERIREEGYDGAFHFAWQDEWFKFTWNTIDLSIPAERRPLWPNRLTNEQNFGVIANEPGEEGEALYLDGETDDWTHRASLLNRLSNLFPGEDSGVIEKSYPGFDLSVAHDEGYLYLLLRNKGGDWDLREEGLYMGFGTLEEGSEASDKVPGVVFPGGIQTLLQLKGEQDSQMFINSAYDYHTWLYGEQFEYVPKVPSGEDPEAGIFLPWKLALNRPLTLPQSGREIPFQDFDVGVMTSGVTDPSDPEFNNLADWYAKGDVLEIRVPWMMLGFTDPSAREVWDNLYEAGTVSPVETEGVRVYPILRSVSSSDSPEEQAEVEPLDYAWQGWDDAPHYHERKKESYPLLRDAFEDTELAGHEEETH